MMSTVKRVKKQIGKVQRGANLITTLSHQIQKPKLNQIIGIKCMFESNIRNNLLCIFQKKFFLINNLKILISN